MPDTYSIPEIMAHMKDTGLGFHEAHDNLIASRGPAKVEWHNCAGCGEPIVRAPDSYCGACLLDD